MASKARPEVFRLAKEILECSSRLNSLAVSISTVGDEGTYLWGMRHELEAKRKRCKEALAGKLKEYAREYSAEEYL